MLKRLLEWFFLTHFEKGGIIKDRHLGPKGVPVVLLPLAPLSTAEPDTQAAQGIHQS